MSNPIKLFRDIQNFILDIDGVFTNGGLTSHDDGTLVRVFDSKDGHALKKLIDHDYHVCIITGGSSAGIMSRLEKFGICHVYLKISKKGEVLAKHCEEHNIDLTKSLYMGDDIPDIDPMEMVALSCCPKDAAKEVKKIAKYISPYAGGKGCLRDVVQKVLSLQGNW